MLFEIGDAGREVLSGLVSGHFLSNSAEQSADSKILLGLQIGADSKR